MKVTPKILRLLALLPFALVADAAEITLPPRPADAESGTAFAARIAPLDFAAREAAILAEIQRGNVPDFWRRFVPVTVDPGVVIDVAPDYLAVGSNDDHLLTPLSPAAAQKLADALGCVLPTRRMVEVIHRAAPLQLTPAPIPPSAAMTTVAVFAEHNASVRAQRTAALAAHSPGTLVAGHKKDVVLTPQLADAPGKVAIYGWHQPDGKPIQPLFLGHAASWVDYSHGVRLVARTARNQGAATMVDALLADPKTAALLSDEGPVGSFRYGAVDAIVVPAAGETVEQLHLDGGVRVVINSPRSWDATKPTRLVLYALPAGNTIEQTIGRRLAPGDDWHFDIQHIGAQTRWLRARVTGTNLVVAYLQCVERSFVLWRRAHPDSPARIGAIVDTLRKRFPAARLTLASHSAGGAFVFGYLDAVADLPADVERLAFLDSNYAYETAKHAAKLTRWLTTGNQHRLCVLAYQDYLALLDGKTFVSESGGTWGRSQAMLHDLATGFPFTRTDSAGLQSHTALDGRVRFFLKENPAKLVLHTRQVELNGFIHAMLVGTPLENQGYTYLGERAYPDLIAPN